MGKRHLSNDVPLNKEAPIIGIRRYDDGVLRGDPIFCKDAGSVLQSLGLRLVATSVGEVIQVDSTTVIGARPLRSCCRGDDNSDANQSNSYNCSQQDFPRHLSTPLPRLLLSGSETG